MDTVLEDIKRKISVGIIENSIQRLERYIVDNSTSKDACLMLSELYYIKENFKLCKRNLFRLVDLDIKREYYNKIISMIGPAMIAPDDYYNSRPEFSTDGSHLIFSSAREDTNYDNRINSTDNSGIYMVNISTGEEYCLVSNAYMSIMPIFSPDNQKILYQSFRRDTNNDGVINNLDNSATFILDLTNGNEREVIPDRFRTKYVKFTPDCKKLIYVSYKNTYDNAGIYMLDLESMIEKEIVSSKYENTFPSISLDQERIVFASWRKDTNGDGKIDLRDNSGIYLLNLVTNEEKCIVDETYNNLFPIFTPDNNHIIFLSTRRDTNNDGIIDTLDNSGIYMADLDGKNEVCLMNDSHYNKFISCSFDNKKIVFISRRIEGESGIIKRKEDLYLNKGIYTLDLDSGKITELINPKYFGVKAPLFSPVEYKIAYHAWRKGKRRGIYLYNLADYTKEGLIKIISKNI